MRIFDRIKRKRTFQFFLIFLLSIILSVAVTLVAQQASAVTPVYSVTVGSVNGAWPPPVNIPNPVELAGTFSAQPGAGLEKEYGVQIGWGDGSPYTVWRYFDSGNASPYLTWSPNGPTETNFTGTYNTNPGGGYPDLGHYYATGGNYTITVKFFHGQPPGAESADSSTSISVHVLVPEISVSKSGPAYAHEGDVITYTITVSNPSSGTMYKVSVVDSLLGDVSGSFSASLAPLASESETFSYTVPSASVSVLNTVTATYEDAGNLPSTASASWAVTVLHPGIRVSKSGPAYAHEGDVIAYTITVSNTGDCPLSSVSVTDTPLGPIYSGGLAFGETETFTVNYTVPTPSGDVANTVTASGSDVLGSIVSDSAGWFVKVQYQFTVTASPAGAVGGVFTVTYTQSGTTYTNVQKTTTWTDWVDSGTIATVSSPQDLIDGAAGTRYKFDRYDPSFSVTMTEPKTVTLFYGSQYYLTVISPFDSPAPTSGWFDDGTEITASVTSPWAGPTGTQYVCTDWTGTGSVPSSGAGTSVAFNITAASTITWIWKTQYYLTVSSAYDTEGGMGWYDDGTTAYATLTDGVVSGGSGTRYVFTGWSGDASGTGLLSNGILMSGPKTAVADWKTQYYLTFGQSGVGSDFTGTVLTVDSSDFDVTGLPVSFWWSEDSVHSFSFASPLAVDAVKQYVWASTTGLSTLESDSLTVTASGSVLGHYVLQNAITFDQTGLSADFAGAVVVVDDTPYGVTALPVSFYWQVGTVHNFVFQSPMTVTAGMKRYVWTGTTGLSSVQSGSITVTTYGSIVGDYKTQYYLTVSSPHATTGGMGWYDSGATAYATLTAGTVSGGAGARYVFAGWSGDASGTGLTSGAVIMNRPKTATANWKTQYYLTVGNGGYGTVSGEGWYDSGTSAPFSIAPTVVSDGVGTRYAFTQWSGASTSASAGAAILMNGAKTVTANWKTQYYLTVTSAYDTAGGQGWYDSGATAYATLLGGVVPDGSGTRYVFTEWSGDASGTNYAQSYPIVMNGPKTATANWKTQYYLTLATNPPGVDASSGAGWYDAGTYASVSAAEYVDVVSGSSRYRFDNWTTSDVSEIAAPSAASTTVFLDGAKTVTADYVLQYLVTFGQTGLDETAVGTVVTIDGSQKAYGDLPFSVWVDNGSTIAYSYEPSVLSGVEGKRFRLDEVEGPVSPVAIEESATITGRYVVQYKVTFAQAGLSPKAFGNVVTVNTSAKALGDLPLEMWVDAGSVLTYSYEATVSSALSCEQYRLESVAGPSSPITVTTDTTVIGNYRTQYYLTMNTNFGAVSPGSGWYDAGSVIQIGASPPGVVEGERFVWLRWAGSGSESYSGVDNPASIKMDGPVTETAAWGHEYYLTVISVHGSPVPTSGWFAAGTEISASVTSQLSGQTGTRYVCTGWTGTGSVSSTGTATSTAFTMNEPSSITWDWKIQYYLTMSTNLGTVSPGDGWYDEGSVVLISAAPAEAVEGKGYVWHGWAGTGGGSFSGVDNPADITVNSPISEAAHWKVLPELTIVVSNETIARGDRIIVYGTTQPSSITEVDLTYTYPNGTEVTHTVQTDDEGRYSDTLLLGEEPFYGLFAQRGQWVITAGRSGNIDQEPATSSTTLGIEAPGLSQILLALLALLIVVAVAISYVIVKRRTNGRKLAHKTWWRAAVVVGLTGLALGAVSLALNWMSMAGTVSTNGETYLVRVSLYPFSPGSASIPGMQYGGPEMPSLISSAWSAVSRSSASVIALYLIPVGCVLALACLYKPKTQPQKAIKLLITVVAGALVLVAVVQFLAFAGIYAGITTGATIGYGVGLPIAMIGGMLAIVSSIFAAKETPTRTKTPIDRP